MIMSWRRLVSVLRSRPSSNLYSTLREQDAAMNVFDRKAKRRQRNRAAMADNVHVYDYIKDEIAYRLADRVGDIARHFPMALDLGCGRGHLNKHLTKDQIGTLVHLDSSEKMLEQCKENEVPIIRVHGDEEFLPFREKLFDVVISSLCLHWVNDLPSTFRQVLSTLKPDGAFIGAMFSGDTLFELRCSLQLAEMEREGGFAAHVSPFTEIRDIGNLLTRAGYNLTTIDSDEITVGYPSMFELMRDLKGMGENAATRTRKHILHRDTLKAAAALYQEMYGMDDGSIPATFQVLYFIGWKPSPVQQKPLEPGSADISFGDLSSLDSLDDDTKEK